MTELQLASTLHQEDPVGNRATAMEHLRKALELDPKNVRALLLKGYLDVVGGHPAQAEESIRRAIEIIESENSPEDTHLLAEARNILGLVLIHGNRLDDAIVTLRQSVTEPTNRAPHFAWGNLAWAYFKKGDYDAALEAATQSVRLQPRFCEGHYRMGEILFAKEDFEGAEQAITRSIEADERCGQFFQEAWRLRGETRARLGHRDDAVADFERCLELGASTTTGQTCRRFLEATH